MKTDIQIAQQAKMEPIEKIARQIGIKKDELELYGDFKAKLKPELWDRIKNKPDGKLILMTATSPTPLGEGKTTTSVGLAMAMNQLGRKTVLALREPSLGPCFGIKGGAAGGGYSQVIPMEDINLHFTGDIHAITSANNLLAALIDNHIYQGNALNIDPQRVVWKRCLDLNDRALRKVKIDLSRKKTKLYREDNFNISVASEIMAILCLTENIGDLKKRLAKIVIGYNFNGQPIFARELKAVGAIAALLKDALKPNLVQTLENTPVIIHGGPFANIAHGCNSVLATRYGLKLGNYLITEAGFGADLGAEKFFDIKCRLAKLKPVATVIVTTIRSLKYNGGATLDKTHQPDELSLKKGILNLEKHLENLKKFGVPALTAINVFPTDRQEEIDFVVNACEKNNTPAAVSRVWKEGGKGGRELAEKLIHLIEKEKADFKPLYAQEKSLSEKIETIAREIYGAKKTVFSQKAAKEMAELKKNKLDKLPVCIAKTQYSLSDNPKLLGRPENFTFKITDVRLSNGAGFVVALAGDINTMPGLPKIPAAENIDLNNQGKINGLF